MRKMLLLAAVSAAVALPGSAMAASGFTTTRMSLRAGPGFDYPIVDRIPSGAAIRIRGCIAGYRWCDVVWRGEYGWARGNDLAFLYHGRRVLVLDYGPEIGLPVVGFSIGTYWREHYHNRPFFARIDQFREGGNAHAERDNATVGIGTNRGDANFGDRHNGERHNRMNRNNPQMNAVKPQHRQHFAPSTAGPVQPNTSNPARAQAIAPSRGPGGVAGAGAHAFGNRGPATVGAGGHGPGGHGGGGHGGAHGPAGAPGQQRQP